MTLSGRSSRRSISPSAKIVDKLADLTVGPGFSRVGFAVRRRLEHWPDPPRMDGRTAVVTGATSGSGLAAATALGTLGADVLLVGRDPTRGALAANRVVAAGAASARLDLCDLSEPSEVLALADRVASSYGRLDALIHNAGALGRTFSATVGGVECTVAPQVLGPYILTARLAGLLGASKVAEAPPTMVIVSSGGMYAQPFDLAALEMGPDDYDGVVAYARAKRAQVEMAGAWAGRFGPFGVASYAMHPGWVDTPGLASGLPRFRSLLRPFLRTSAQGADTAVWLAAGGPAAQARSEGSPLALSGFFQDRHPRSVARFPVTHPTHPGDGDALLGWCAQRTGVELPDLGGGS